MPIVMPTDTADILGLNAKRCESRSLYFDKFADPSAKDSGTQTSRTDWFERVTGLKPVRVKLHSWTRWLGESGLTSSDILLVKLQSRLMVNMAGGVMENAGLCLDRFGVPYIPGTAVKGCARRMAIQHLTEGRETSQKAEVMARLLADIALIFGWGQDDWKTDQNKDGHLKSDFVYGVGVDKWPEVWRETGCLLLGADPKEPEDFGHFAGAVSFLPAYPRELPANDLELDVVTCHHPDYYQRKQPVALDTEEPNPVKFIAVAAGVTFAFVTVPLRGDRRSLSQSGAKLHILARDWLREGLETFGLGGKTAAGYGWLKEDGATRGAAAASFAGEQGSIVSPPAGAAGPSEHPLIAQWRGKTQPPNFRVFRPLLVALSDDDLKTVFYAIMPVNELARLKRSNPYWQSFTAHADGVTILRRLKIELQ